MHLGSAYALPPRALPASPDTRRFSAHVSRRLAAALASSAAFLARLLASSLARQPESVPAAGPVTQIQVAKCAAGNLSPTVSGSTGQPNCPMSAGHRGPSGRPAVSNPGRPRLGNDGPGGLSLHQEAFEDLQRV
jgi:hypothetical protein